MKQQRGCSQFTMWGCNFPRTEGQCKEKAAT